MTGAQQVNPDGLDDLRQRTHAKLSPLLPEDPQHSGPWIHLARLPQGGGGRVYLAHNPARPGELTVVKLLNPVHDRADKERFEREVRNAQLLRHSRFVAQIIDFVTEPSPYVVQEFVAGPTLETFLADSAQRPPEQRIRTGMAVSISTGLLEAIAAAHDARVVHRDVKPQNVIVNDPRGPVLIDFGISRLADESRLTGALPIGTAKYMSPERMDLQAGDPSVDVFAWAIITAQTMTGKHPFDVAESCVTTRDWVKAISNGEPDLREVPQAYQAVLAEALHHEPGRRPTAIQLVGKMGAIARDPAAGLDSDGLGPNSTRPEWLASYRALDPAQFLRSLVGINSASAAGSDRDRRELLRAARGPTEKLAVRIHYHPQSLMFTRTSVWLLIIVAFAVAGLVTGAIATLAFDVIRISLT